MRSFILAALAAFACARGRPEKPADVQTQVHLAAAASCQSLTQSVRDTAVRQMRSQLDEEKNWGGFYWGTPADAGTGATPMASGSAPASFTTTNTQVAGVDEADFVKNDGTRIFVLSGRTLFAAKSWPPQNLAFAGKLEIEGWPGSMFLDGDQVVVFSNLWTVPQGGGMGGGARPGCGPGPFIMCTWGWSTTKITVVDVSDLAAPKVQSEIYLPGSSTGSRRMGSSVRLVLADVVRWPEALKWWPDYDPALYQDQAKMIAAIDALEDGNERIIRATPLEKWFPEPQRKLADGTSVDVGYQCSDFYLSNAPERLGLVTIATLDLAHLDAGISRASIVGEPGLLYATEKHLYLASEHWWWWRLDGQRDYTYVHEFDLGDPARAVYVGSGGVEGHPGDQFSLDEKGGYLRVATSTVRYQAGANPHQFVWTAGSRLSVLAPGADGALKLVGEIPSIVDGERLTAMRFVGDRGFAVTFRNIDPLATLDLSDPTHPRKVAELTMPGFSTYLQPIDDTHLLAIGEELPLDSAGHADWNKRSVQLSLFDVGDLAHPVRSAQALVGTAWAYSEALWDHHAFNWYRPDPAKPGLLAIPFSDWIQPVSGQNWWDGFVSDLRLFSVDPAGSITAAGALGLADVYLQQGSGNWTWWYRPWVRRSVMATDPSAGTFVYAISDAGIRVAPLGNLSSPLATALFPKSVP